jgi:hypothetical protein
MAKLEVLYNDDCPICRREIKHYAGLSGDAVEFVKITEQSAADWGLTPTIMQVDQYVSICHQSHKRNLQSQWLLLGYWWVVWESLGITLPVLHLSD